MQLRPHLIIGKHVSADQATPEPKRRTAVRSWALPVILPLAFLASACGGAEETGSEQEQNTAAVGEEAPAEPTADLHAAQPAEFDGATLVEENSESGVYSELATVKYGEELKASTELDKPECLEAAPKWASLDTVQSAPASVASYEWSEGTVTHIFVQMGEESAAQEAMAAEVESDCSTYTATYENGTTAEYSLTDLDTVPQVADESRAFSVETSSDAGDSRMYSITYRNGDILGTTTVMGSGELADYQEMLVGFTEAAVELQQQKLG
ncbi:hypothetical protein ACOALZ_11690 [Nocardiopsis algeriensis]|uniref:hypothetical protein n=1 Tax=Nocardiopsis algeriensis TaxID=1478215 RepID=UPI003B43260C